MSRNSSSGSGSGSGVGVDVELMRAAERLTRSDEFFDESSTRAIPESSQRPGPVLYWSVMVDSFRKLNMCSCSYDLNFSQPNAQAGAGAGDSYSEVILGMLDERLLHKNIVRTAIASMTSTHLTPSVVAYWLGDIVAIIDRIANIPHKKRGWQLDEVQSEYMCREDYIMINPATGKAYHPYAMLIKPNNSPTIHRTTGPVTLVGKGPQGEIVDCMILQDSIGKYITTEATK